MIERTASSVFLTSEPRGFVRELASGGGHSGASGVARIGLRLPQEQEAACRDRLARDDDPFDRRAG